ncbi:MAG: chromate resistance protein [Betaproteobacteria bacterium]|nr:chromate resistance protein [Betaproteobacteria bacterium]
MDTVISSVTISQLLQHSNSKWVTRERPKIDRIACPWLIRRFIDPRAQFLYVPSAEVRAVAKAEQAIPYDVPEVQFSHRGELCSFDAFLADFGLDDPALADLALIVRGADTGKLELTPQSPGLLAVSLGLSLNYPDDHAMLEHGMVVYDALYAWIRTTRAEIHNAAPIRKQS